MSLAPDSWREVFALETPLLELLARGTVLYFAIVIFLRFMPRRTGGEIAVMDLVFVVLIAEAAAHALGDYDAIADALVLIATLMTWNYLLNFVSFRSRFVERLITPPPLQVVRNGELLWRNMRRELLTREELMDQLRHEGIDDLAKVKTAYVEPEGKLTFICA